MLIRLVPEVKAALRELAEGVEKKTVASLVPTLSWDNRRHLRPGNFMSGTSASGHDADQRSEESVGYPGFYPIALRRNTHDPNARALLVGSPPYFPRNNGPA